MNNIVILRLEDWEALYVNGDEKLQSETITISDINEFCPIESIEQRIVFGNLKEHTSRNGYFPSTLRECDEIGYTF